MKNNAAKFVAINLVCNAPVAIAVVLGAAPGLGFLKRHTGRPPEQSTGRARRTVLRGSAGRRDTASGFTRAEGPIDFLEIVKVNQEIL